MPKNLSNIAKSKKNKTHEIKYLKKAVALASHDLERQSQYYKRLASL